MKVNKIVRDQLAKRHTGCCPANDEHDDRDSNNDVEDFPHAYSVLVWMRMPRETEAERDSGMEFGFRVF